MTAPFGRTAEWIERCGDDADLRVAARSARVEFAVSSPEGDRVRFAVDHGKVRPGLGEAEFELRAPRDAWARFFEPAPAPRFHHFLAMRMRIEGTRVLGDERAYAQHARIAHRVLAIGRELLHGAPSLPEEPVIDRSVIREHYVRIALPTGSVDIHVARAGQGAPLLVLHTAGADARQAHALLSDAHLTARHEVIAFDLPGHGGSGRLPGPWGGWSLTTELYGDIILAVVAALDLHDPVLLGASMAGEVCLEMAYRAPEVFRGVIACEASEKVPGRTTPWARDPRVDGMTFMPEWIAGLIGPAAPAGCRDDILWMYSQGGAGTFAGDIDFYSGDWDGTDKVARIDTGRCRVVMMTGEYDYSCTPDMSRATAEKIPGATFWTMPGLGHFPICENPAAFAPHLARALEQIHA
ncbi:alpha/beta fold hydrolase [Microbacterium sp. Marseille-Q6965]|uniref:alpha/beta fold hydrolase n=1 Tax=Microbacterium sp. Marseille-Q6965 TaxID=2965072 RepID=UPI0021B82A85|nr:alpha/beta hydrolase [Microbacterium sp. Marseille-Q6965]